MVALVILALMWLLLFAEGLQNNPRAAWRVIGFRYISAVFWSWVLFIAITHHALVLARFRDAWTTLVIRF